MNSDVKDSLVSNRHRTVPIPSTIESVPRYPQKLVIFRIAASKFYWARFYDSGRIYKRSTKTDIKRDAQKAAIAFYEELLTRKAGGGSIGKNSRFEVCAKEVLKSQEARIKRGEISATLNANESSRLQKHLLPYFRQYDVTQIDYFLIETYLNQLSSNGLKPATVKLHESLLRKILKHAHRKQIISHLPAFPSMPTVDAPRAYFTSPQYSKLHNKAKALIGTELVLKSKTNKALRRVRMTEELYNLILFMTNTFIRPTDIKVLKNSNIDIVRGQNVFLRLSHPPTKKHDGPMISMPAAVDVYERQTASQKKRGYGKREDYVFMPEHQNRDYALVQLRRQFDHLLEETKLKTDGKGSVRTLYSLRHTAIMFRAVNAEGLDTLTLARNARTSVDMLERFYLSHLQGEMNVVALQSQKHKKKTSAKNKEKKVARSKKERAPT